MKKYFLSVLLLLPIISITGAELPEGITPQEYILTASDYDNGEVQYDVKLAFDGSDAYLGNFAFNARDCWLKGSIDGNTVTFPEDQILTTLEDDTEIWFYGVSFLSDGVSSSDFVLHYDATADEYIADCGLMLTLGRPTDQLNYLEILEDVLISKSGRRIEPEVNFSTEIISMQPAGELRHYARSGFAYVNFFNSPIADIQDGIILNMVYDADGSTVYMQSPISQAGTTSWIKGYIEGDQLHVPLYQSIVKDGNNYGITGICRWNRSHTYLEPYLRATEITFTIDAETGVITQNGDDAYVLLWSKDMSWSHYADLNSVYTPFSGQYETIPENLQKEQMAVTYRLDDGTETRLVVTGALDAQEGKYYIAGLATADPEAAIVGTVDGNTIVFPSNQYVGSSAKCLAYFSAANYTITDQEFGGMIFHFLHLDYLDNLTLTLNAETGVWTTAEDVAITINKGMAYDGFVNYFAYQLNPGFAAYEEHPAVPCDPQIVRYRTEMANGGYDCLNLLIKTEDANGGFINPQRLAYQIFVDVDGTIEPYVIRSDEYLVPSDMEVIPFVFSVRDLSNATDISVGGTEIYLYETGFDNIGVQVINYSGGVEERSNLVWWKEHVDYTTDETTPDQEVADIDLGEDPDSITWSYYTGNENLGSWGTSKAETYYVGMKVSDASLIGSAITSVNVPLNITGVTDCSLWFVRNNLKKNSGCGESDVMNVPFTPTGEWTEVTLPKQFPIGEGDFYVGITFTAKEGQRLPLLLLPAEANEMTFVRTTRSYRKWVDLSNSPGAVLPLQLTVCGDVAHQNAVSVVSLSNVFVKHGDDITTTVTLSNNGGNEVSNIDMIYVINGRETELHLEQHIAADYYGQQSSFPITVPGIAENGLYEGELTVTKVNDVANNSKANFGSHTVKVMNVVPKKRPLMEEFTGAWCGFCPSGFVAMRLMNERYPDDFICASYHNRDAMMITDNYPVDVPGFPHACLDRNHDTDAYRGDYASDMGIEQTWLKECEETSPANIDVVAELNVPTGILTATANIELCEDVTGTDYGIAYIITADGLSGTGPNWRQHNYYSKSYNNGANSGMYLEGMDEFNNGPEYMYLTYDDVAIATSAEGGATIANVIPADCAEGEIFTHSFEFQIADMNSTYGTRANLVQDNTKLHAIALIYDNATHQVLNCAKCNVLLTETEAIQNLHESDDEDDIVRYSVDGRRIGTHNSGICIERHSDGTAHKLIK